MPLDLADVLAALGPTAPHIAPLWDHLRLVSLALLAWAADAYEARLMVRAQDLVEGLNRCYAALDTRDLVFSDGTEHHGRRAMRSIIILGGTAQLIVEALIARHPAAPDTYDRLLDFTYPDFDAQVLDDVPLRGGLTFAHVSELLMRAGEIRLFASPEPDTATPERLLWAEPDRIVRDACAAYCRFQRCRWAWPSRGIPELYGTEVT